jgi:hypothetical protein
VKECKDKNGKLVGEEKEILGRWAEHFRELMNKNEDSEISFSKDLRRDGDEEERNVEIPLREEVESVINKIRNNRTPGEDDVVAELIKYGGPTIKETMYKLIVMVWENEIMPECWKTGLKCPFFKKGDKLVCGNCRDIILLSVAYKILSGVLNERLKAYVEKIFGQYQCGFSPYRSMIDQIFVI